VHWKNLGLVLGYQNRLREALYAYGRARETCGPMGSPFFPGLLHGNAWLKAAIIHGKLLENNGDLRIAWRLFLEYRGMLGDDYSFCLNFADFAFQLDQHELAWRYADRARELQPACPNPHQLLLQIAPRMPGEPAEIKARLTRTRTELERARKEYRTGDAAWRLARLCSGLRDGADSGNYRQAEALLDPDPLAGYGPDRPPDWLLAAAERRRPFEPFDPSVAATPREGPTEPPRVGATEPSPARDAAGPRWWAVVVPALVVLAVLVFLFSRPRRKKRAATP
jgi:hypothetical protein